MADSVTREKQAAAVDARKIISSKEARGRRRIGTTLLAVCLAWFAVRAVQGEFATMSLGLWAFLVCSGSQILETGNSNLKLNGKFKPIPDEYKAFAGAMRRQYQVSAVKSIGLSVLACVLACIWLVPHDDIAEPLTRILAGNAIAVAFMVSLLWLPYK